MTTSQETLVADLRANQSRLRSLLSRSKSKQVKAKSIIEGARSTVNYYFNEMRPSFLKYGLDNEGLGGLDTLMQDLLVHTQKASMKKS